jgi:hypothetical protein
MGTLQTAQEEAVRIISRAQVRDPFLSLLKNKGFKEERRTKVGLYAIGKTTTLESNKSHFPLSAIRSLRCSQPVNEEMHAWHITGSVG